MCKTFKIVFYLKKPKGYVDGNLPVYLRLTIDGERIEMFTQRSCAPDKWNSVNGRMKGCKEEVKQFNNYLELLQSKIYEAQRDLLSAGFEVTASSIRNKIHGKEERQKTIREVYQYHNKQFAELVGKEFAPGTLKKFKTAFASLEAFIQWKFHTTDLPIKALNFQFITDYEFYLKSVRSLQHNSAMGIIKKLKKIVRQCVANDWLDKDPFMSYKVKIRETNRNFLTESELQVIMEKELVVERLVHVRDIFVFSCFTGLAYSDVEKLTPPDITTGIDGEKWIFTTRTKTDTPSRIPLLPAALLIIEKYNNSPKLVNTGKLLPVPTNQRLNSYLKELAAVCGITKELTFHCARHTFATTVTLSNGVPIETVSKMLGHKTIRTTQHYAKILDKKVSTDMKVLINKYRKETVPVIRTEKIAT